MDNIILYQRAFIWSRRIIPSLGFIIVIYIILNRIITNPHYDEHIYWQWKREHVDNSISERLQTAFNAVNKNPRQMRFYVPIANLCTKLEMEHACYERLSSLRQRLSSHALISLEVALGQTSAKFDSALAAHHIMRAAKSKDLSSRLARILVDDSYAGRSAIDAETLRELWSTSGKSTLGQSWGHAYILVRSQEWEDAEAKLRTLSDAGYNDPEIFRELGRIYFSLGKKDDCFRAVTMAVKLARRVGDLEAELLGMGNLLYLQMRWIGEAEEIRNSLLQLVDLGMRIGDLQVIARSRIRLGELEGRRANYEVALRHFDMAEGLADHISAPAHADLLAARAEALRRMHRYDAAERDLKNAQEIAIESGLITSQLNVSYYLVQLYMVTGRIYMAQQLANRILTNADDLELIDLQSSVRIQIGDIMVLTSNYEDAIEIYKEALAYSERDGSKWRMREINLRIGQAYMCLMNIDESTKHFYKSIQTDSYYIDSLSIGQYHYEIATIYLRVKNYSSSHHHAIEAIRYLKDTSNDNMMYSIYLMMAEIYYINNQVDASWRSLNEAEKLISASRHEFDIAYTRGFLLLEDGSFLKAVLEFRQSERLADGLGAIPYAWRSFYGKAVALWKLGRPEEAEASFREALDRIEARRDRISATVNRSLLSSLSFDLYKSYAAFLDDQGRYSEAIAISERGRSRALVDLLYSTQISRGRSFGAPLERAIHASTRSRAFAEDVIDISTRDDVDEAGRTGLAYMLGEQRSADALFKKLEHDLRGSEPLYTYSPVGVEEAQAVLGPDEAILMYSLRTESPHNQGASVAYVIRRDSLALVPLTLQNENVEEAVRFFRDAITNSERGPGTDWEPTAKKLYRLLVEPTLPFVGLGVEHLHIIPEGALHYLPFAALQDEEGHFLVERFDLSLVPSLTVLKLCRQQNPMQWENILLFADPDENLPGARHEASLIAARRPETSRLIVGTDVTQELLEKEASGYDILHFATHGSFKARSPLASQLKMYDDVLTVDEVGQLDLNAYLVTLSACETALSGGLLQDHAPGEEWVGLYQSFLAAGTPTVVASLWTIHDRYSGPLMSRFYDHLEQGGKGRALAEVQRSFISDERTSHPYYWAAFSVLGDPK